MTPKFTKAMAKEAIADGAEVKEPEAPRQKRQIQRPPPVATPMTTNHGPEIAALKAEVGQLKRALEDEKKASENRAQELTEVFKALAENKPMRLKPIRDMERGSPTYLLVSHYDFVPVSYQPRKLDS
jgi:hypothetical protein